MVWVNPPNRVSL